MNEVATVLGISAVFDREEIDCGTWCPVGLEGGAVLDYCAVCSRPFAEHPPDAVEDEGDHDD